MDKNLKFIIIGGSGGGSNVAVDLRYKDENSEILIIERESDISYSNCSMPYYFSGEIDNIEDLIENTKEDFKNKYNIDVRINSDVIKINKEEKYIEIKNLKADEIYREYYDYLIITTGAESKFPENFRNEKIFKIRVLEDIKKIDKFLKDNEVKDVAVVGNGYIGIEIAESFRIAGKNVTLIGSRDQLLTNIDEDMTQILHKEAIDNDINLILNNRLKEVKDNAIILEDGTTINADLIILSIGITPASKLAEDAGLLVTENNSIKIDDNYKTSDNYIYAIGDVTEIYNPIIKSEAKIPLAGAIYIGSKKLSDGIYGSKRENHGFIGPSALRFFNLNIGHVGLNESQIKSNGYDYDFSYISGDDRAINGKSISLKLLFEKPSGRILGATVIGYGDILKELDPISIFIKYNMTIYELYDTEFAYHPIYSRPLSLINIAAYNAIEILEGNIKKIPVREVRKIVEDGKFILDTRDEESYNKKHLRGSINIPRNTLRSSIDKIPKDKEIYVDRFSSYKILKNMGFENAIYIESNIKEIEIYEFYKDKLLDRESIIVS